MKTLAAVVTLLALRGTTALAQPQTIDDFTKIDAWQVIPSDGVHGEIQSVPSKDGTALRLNFNFARGSGYCIARRQVDLPLGENYRFRFDVRGQTPPNTLEFKLIAPSNEDVWWSVRREYDFPQDWTTLTYGQRHIAFAWGPSAGAPLTRVAAIELVVTAAAGGSGWVEFDNLTFEPLPISVPIPNEFTAAISSRSDGDTAQPIRISKNGRLDWSSAPQDNSPTITLDLGAPAEVGGLRLDWQPGAHATAYEVLAGNNPAALEMVASMKASNGETDFVLLPGAEGRYVRLRTTERAGPTVGLRSLQLYGPQFAESPNDRYAEIAQATPRGWYPRIFLGRQTPWTVVGVPADAKEALFDILGSVETDRRGYRIDPFLFTDGRLITWADVTATPSLLEGYLPIPQVTWTTDGLRLEIDPLAHGEGGASSVTIRYRITNTGDAKRKPSLFLALRPFQVLPPWQNLGTEGGVTTVRGIRRDSAAVQIADHRPLKTLTTPTAFGATTWAAGDIVEWLARGTVPPDKSVTDPDGHASAALQYKCDLAPGASRDVYVRIPLHDAAAQADTTKLDPAAEYAALRSTMQTRWAKELNRTQLELPPAAKFVVDTYRTVQAHILINADGPAIQPGSRTYERSWIRDGALTSTALLYTGHADRVRAFIDWFLPYQYDNGKVPCVVDRRGPDPVPEHDSTGQMIYLLARYYEFTGDRTPLESFYPNVVAGVEYLEGLRAKRKTPEYREGLDDNRVLYGLVPESISHEGYSAKPMHSYWDGFFVIRGYRDAAIIADVLGKTDDAARFAALRDDYRKCMYDSIRLAMKNRSVDHVPGCAELGDFDATSTAIGVYPCNEREFIPEPALTRTFQKYLDFFRDRRDGRREWENYTPYELRVMSALIHLNQPAAAHELLSYFLADQAPPAWNQWGEVVWRDHDTPRFIGDYPHTWAASEFLRAVRNMFVFERESDGAVVLGAGLAPAWLTDRQTVAITNWPTRYGTLTYRLTRNANTLHLTLNATQTPPAGFVIRLGHLGPCAAARVNGRPVDLASNGDVHLETTKADVTVTMRPSDAGPP